MRWRRCRCRTVSQTGVQCPLNCVSHAALLLASLVFLLPPFPTTYFFWAVSTAKSVDGFRCSRWLYGFITRQGKVCHRRAPKKNLSTHFSVVALLWKSILMVFAAGKISWHCFCNSLAQAINNLFFLFASSELGKLCNWTFDWSIYDADEWLIYPHIAYIVVYF